MSKENTNLESKRMHSVQMPQMDKAVQKLNIAKVEIKVSIERLIPFFFDLKFSHSIFKILISTM